MPRGYPTSPVPKTHHMVTTIHGRDRETRNTQRLHRELRIVCVILHSDHHRIPSLISVFGVCTVVFKVLSLRSQAS